MSSDSVGSTRVVCKQALEAIGVSVIVENAEGLPVLKCRVSQLFGVFPCSTCSTHVAMLTLIWTL